MENRLLLALRRFCRRRRRPYRRSPVRLSHLGPIKITFLLALVLSVYFIALLELRLRPVVEQVAARQVNNQVTATLNSALSGLQAGYENLVEIQRGEDGSITAVTSNMEQVNHIRTQGVQVVLETIAAIDVHTLGIPLGSLFDFDLLWAKGPEIQVHSLVAGTVNTQVYSDFRSAGINQTLHRILLDVEVPLAVLLPGSRAETMVCVTVCVAETVIVGRVPQTYLNMAGGNTYEPQAGSGTAAAGADTGGI